MIAIADVTIIFLTFKLNLPTQQLNSIPPTEDSLGVLYFLLGFSQTSRDEVSLSLLGWVGGLTKKGENWDFNSTLYTH